MKWMQRAAAWLLVMVLVLTFLPGLEVKAEEKQYGMVNYSTLKVRSDAGTENKQIGLLVKGSIVEILGEKEASNGVIWYQVAYGETQGYSSSEYIDLCEYPLTELDPDFEEKLNEENFPESYKEYLRLIHAQYPSWEFKALHTGLTWEEVIAGEMVDGRSVVSGSSISSWKSTSDSAYDWKTSTWKTGWDSGNWVLASEEILSYYMDPRNFLTVEAVFQFLEQSFSEKQTVDGVRNIVKNTFLAEPGVELDGTQIDYAQVIYNAGKTEGVNPYVLASMIIQEMGSKGTSGSISGTYEGFEGLYNYYNIGAYKNERFTAIQRGLWYAGGGDNGNTTYKRPWTSREKAIIGGANFYAQSYILAGQDTLYLKKYNVQGDNLYKHQYMTNVNGAFGESISLAKGYGAEARQETLIFEIPVFQAMPEKPCPIPMGDGSPNNKLSSVAVTGYDLTPDFDMDTAAYDLVVGNQVTSVEITAAAYDDTALIQGTGTYNLAVGDNTFVISVMAENGDMREYTVTIARKTAEDNSPVVTGITLTMKDQQVYGINPGTNVETALKGIRVDNGSAVVVNSKNAQKDNTERVGTGDSLVIYDVNGGEYGRYTVIIRGEVSGDGLINTSDLIKVRNHILGTTVLQEPYNVAVDTNSDGKVTTGDLIKVRNHILGVAAIAQ